jgi:hypothetical protein
VVGLYPTMNDCSCVEHQEQALELLKQATALIELCGKKHRLDESEYVDEEYDVDIPCGLTDDDRTESEHDEPPPKQPKKDMTADEGMDRFVKLARRQLVRQGKLPRYTEVMIYCWRYMQLNPEAQGVPIDHIRSKGLALNKYIYDRWNTRGYLHLFDVIMNGDDDEFVQVRLEVDNAVGAELKQALIVKNAEK